MSRFRVAYPDMDPDDHGLPPLKLTRAEIDETLVRAARYLDSHPPGDDVDILGVPQEGWLLISDLMDAIIYAPISELEEVQRAGARRKQEMAREKAEFLLKEILRRRWKIPLSLRQRSDLFPELYWKGRRMFETEEALNSMLKRLKKRRKQLPAGLQKAFKDHS